MKYPYVHRTLSSIPTPITKAGVILLLSLVFTSCGWMGPKSDVIVSVRDQKMALVREGILVKTYPISTSKFGLGDRSGSGRTPLGSMKVARKIGEGAPSGAVFKSRQRTGEVIPPNAPGRDPIVTRIMWLKGMEFVNRNAFSRYIYIHGTPEERTIGHPASYGCIRMKSKDIIDLYKRLQVGDEVEVVRHSLDRYKVEEKEVPKRDQKG